jgi:hypothetical protein
MPTKYQQSPLPEDNREPVVLGPTNLPDGKRVKIYNDGTLEAENIRERDSKQLSLNFTEKGKKYYFSKELDENTSEEYVPHDITKQYRTKVSRSFQIKQAFAVYEGEVRKFVVKELDRYKSLRKSWKKQVDKILKTKNEFIFTNTRYGSLWNKIYVDSTQFGPYNHDTKLLVSRELDFINDLIVIRTGETHTIYDKSSNSFIVSPSGSTIVWVSPHEVLNYSGAGNYVVTGTALVESLGHSGSHSSGVSFFDRNIGLVNNTGVYAISSRFIKILENEQIKTQINYNLINSSELIKKQQDWGIENSVFYYAYPEYKDKALTGMWDGTIPSGASFSIETWSTNPRYIGFDGGISVVPVDASKAEDIDISFTEEGEGVSSDYQASVRIAVNKAKSRFYKKLNKILVDKGHKYKSKGFVRYEKMLEKVAQDVYDGLGIVRNEQVAKLQVTPTDPSDSPMYYDGSSELYGGSLEHSAYDALYTSKARQYTDLSTTDATTTTSSSSSSTGGSSY